MPDATYDAIIIGGGTKGLALAMYLQRYGGMSVGIFERRHEVGGGWATEESAAPGFLANTHATMIFLSLHYTALQRDFPEFDDYGGEVDMYVANNSAIFRDNQTCLVTYSAKHDPTQEKSAREIARFSERDAELWLKLWDMRKLFLDMIVAAHYHPPAMGQAMQGQVALSLMAACQEKGIQHMLDPVYNTYSVLRSTKEAWESKEMQCLLLRQCLSAGIDVSLPVLGYMETTFWAAMLPYMCFNVGGTHQVAHACHKILIADGAKIWTHCEVDKIIIENGTAKGIRLTDGTEIGARKLVVSSLSPQQLVDLIGRENLSPQIVRRVDLIETSHTTIAWYNWALHEGPKYIAAQFNPDINLAYWLGLHQTNNPDSMARDLHWRRLGKMPPIEDFNPTVWGHSRVDPRYAPPGKFLASHEQYMPPASALSEREWLQLKKQHAEDMISLWQTFAPNMTWDNVIGYASDTPYDCCRLKNMAPNGNWSIVDQVPWQVGPFRPIPELADHKTPIKNLYATGSAWEGGGGTVGGSYGCYKAIAEDLGLAKPWLEPGKEEPESLSQQVLMTEKRLQEKAKAEAK